MTTATETRPSIAAALRQARREVSIVVWDGQYAVNTYSERYGAWEQGRPTWYRQARHIAKQEVAERALSLFFAADGIDAYFIPAWVERNAWEPISAAELVRRGVRHFGGAA